MTSNFEISIEIKDGGREMKCWECKQQISKARRVCYLDNQTEKTRDVCLACEKQLSYDPCHFVRVKSIRTTQLRGLK